MSKHFEYFSTYLDYLHAIKHASSHTISSYIEDVFQFYEFYKNYDPLLKLQDIDHHNIRSYLVFLHEREYKRSSIARKLAALRSYFNYLNKQNIINGSSRSAARRRSAESSAGG